MARKRFIILILILLVLLAGTVVMAAKKDSARISLNHYSLTIGVGWTHYINSLVIGKDNASINSAGVSLKFFWEPEHRLSLGLETGFYKLYNVKSMISSDMSGHASMSAIPLLLTLRMRIIDHFYLSVGAGLAAMFNKVTGFDTRINSTIWSLSNYQYSGSYIYPLNKHWLVGGEFKVLNFGKADDWMYSIQALCAVKL
ncbi:MAG: outer membrane beta-barrel protein [Bacteroidales bacterium]|jgi:hypothetical protein|nr:outer membrane beta-barrel protein [Bacteroidales bacterium]